MENKMDDIFKAAGEAKTQYATLMATLEHVVLSNIDKLPDNPEITRVGKGMIIKSSDLLAGEAIWSVYFRDWKLQFEDIKGVVADAFDGRLSGLNILLNKGLIQHNGNTERIHPTVLQLVRPVLTEIQTLCQPINYAEDLTP